VKVANDFKAEAQVDVEQLTEELAALRDLHARTNDEMMLLKQQAARSQLLLHRASPLASTGVKTAAMPMTPTPAVTKTASSSNLMAPNSCSKVNNTASNLTRTPLAGVLSIPRAAASSSSSTLAAGGGDDIKSRIDAYLAAVSPSASISACVVAGRGVAGKRTFSSALNIRVPRL